MEWELPRVAGFEWSAPPEPITREQWVQTDGGFWVYPPAGTDREPVWISDREAREARLWSLEMLSAILNVIPGVGDVKGVVECVVGTDVLTGEKLSWMERALGVTGLLGDATGRLVDDAGKVILPNAARVLDAGARADEVLDYQALVESQTGPLLADAAEQIREGADVDSLEWRHETTALLQVGMAEAARLTDAIAQRHPMSPEQAQAVREIVFNGFVRQAQADGLLPDRLQVVPSAAEGGDPSESIDVWDPMTGTAWDVGGTPSSSHDRVGASMSGPDGVTTIKQVEVVATTPP